MSRLLQAVNEQVISLSKMEKLNAFASVLDRSREVSIQEAVYRIFGLQMTRSSIQVKYISTVHPNCRDGLLRSDIEDLKEDESVFHMSCHQYYEVRPFDSSNTDQISYHPDELEKDYWANLCLADFWSRYEIVYGVQQSKTRKVKSNLNTLS